MHGVKKVLEVSWLRGYANSIVGYALRYKDVTVVSAATIMAVSIVHACLTWWGKGKLNEGAQLFGF